MRERKPRGEALAFAVALAVLFFVAGWGLRSGLGSPEPTPEAAPEAAPEAVAAPVAAPEAVPEAGPDIVFEHLGEAPSFGSDAPLVNVMVCTDFQCPVCGRAAREMYMVMEALKDKVRFEIRNNALEMHRHAEQAAIAGLAAQRQGKFWAMHDGMFKRRQLSEEGLLGEARSSGLDIERYQHDIADPRLREQVIAESLLCRALGARGTPAYFINGERHVGWGSAFGFQRIVEKHIGLAEAALAQGTPQPELYRMLAGRHATEPEKFVSLVLDRIAPARK